MTPAAPRLVRRLVGLVARHARLPPSAVVGSLRREAVLARHIVMYLAAVDLELTQDAVAAALGLHRTRVGRAVAAIEDRRDEAGFDAELERLERAAIAISRPPPAPVRRNGAPVAVPPS